MKSHIIDVVESEATLSERTISSAGHFAERAGLAWRIDMTAFVTSYRRSEGAMKRYAIDDPSFPKRLDGRDAQPGRGVMKPNDHVRVQRRPSSSSSLALLSPFFDDRVPINPAASQLAQLRSLCPTRIAFSSHSGRMYSPSASGRSASYSSTGMTTATGVPERST